jgi:hypothetical protein
VLVASADAPLLVVRPMWTAYQDVSIAARELRAMRAEAIGVVVVQAAGSGRGRRK